MFGYFPRLSSLYLVRRLRVPWPVSGSSRYPDWCQEAPGTLTGVGRFQVPWPVSGGSRYPDRCREVAVIPQVSWPVSEGCRYGLLSLLFKASQGASLGNFPLAYVCPIEKVTLWEGLLYLMSESETDGSSYTAWNPLWQLTLVHFTALEPGLVIYWNSLSLFICRHGGCTDSAGVWYAKIPSMGLCSMRCYAAYLCRYRTVPCLHRRQAEHNSRIPIGR